MRQVENIRLLKICLILFAGGILLSGCSSGPVMNSNWEAASAVNQQTEREWGPVLRTINDKTSVFFGSKNDGEYVTFRFATSNMLDIMKILRSGLILTIKSDGNTKFSINYPMHKTDDHPRMEGFSPEQGPRASEDRVKDDIQHQDEFALLDEKDNPISSYFISNSVDIKPQLLYKSGQLIYQVQIPLGRRIDKYMNISIKPGDLLSLKVATPEMKRPDGNRGKGGEGMGIPGGEGRGGEGMGGMGGGRGGRGRGAGGEGGGMPGMTRAMTPLDLDFQVQLNPGTSGTK